MILIIDFPLCSADRSHVCYCEFTSLICRSDNFTHVMFIFTDYFVICYSFQLLLHFLYIVPCAKDVYHKSGCFLLSSVTSSHFRRKAFSFMEEIRIALNIFVATPSCYLEWVGYSILVSKKRG